MSGTKTIATVASTGALLTLAACGGGQDGDSVTLTAASYGGTFESAQIEAWQEPYSAENPDVEFANTSPSDPAMIQAQVDAGNVEWDLADVSPYFAAEYCDELVEPLDLPNVDTSQYDDEVIGDCYFGTYQYSLILSYNTDTWPDEDSAPATVADFFDSDTFPGQRGVVGDTTTGIIEYGLLGDDVAPEDMYPLDVERSLESWDSIRSDTTFAESNGALLQAATSDQLDMMLMVTARTKAALDEGAPFEPIWDTTVSTFQTLVVPKGAPNTEEAMSFIDSVLTEHGSARFAELAGVGTTHAQAQPELDENATTVNAYDDSVNSGEVLIMNAEWWAENRTEATEDFNAWLNQ